MKLKISLLGIFLLIISCALAPKKQQHLVDVQEIEVIPLGISAATVADKFGKPDKELKEKDELTWFYHRPQEDIPRASFIFDSFTMALVHKTIFLVDSDPEANLEWLLKDHFRNEFALVNYPQCGWDFVPAEALYVDKKSGISISFHKLRRQAEAIGWTTAQRAIQDIKDIEQCKGRDGRGRSSH